MRNDGHETLGLGVPRFPADVDDLDLSGDGADDMDLNKDRLIKRLLNVTPEDRDLIAMHDMHAMHREYQRKTAELARLRMELDKRQETNKDK